MSFTLVQRHQLEDGIINDIKVADNANIAQSKIAKLEHDLLALANYMSPIAPIYSSPSVVILPKGVACRDELNTRNIIFDNNTVVSFGVSGPNGLMTGLVKTNNTWYYLWVIGDSSGNTPPAGLLTTSSTSITNMPPGYDVKRCLPLAVRIHNNDILPFSITGWPYCPYIHYNTNMGVVSGQTQISTGSASNFVTRSLASFVPPISKLSKLHIYINHHSTGVASAAVRDASSSGAGTIFRSVVGSSSENGDISCEFTLPTDSNQAIGYKNNADTVFLHVAGYHVTEMHLLGGS